MPTSGGSMSGEPDEVASGFARRILIPSEDMGSGAYGSGRSGSVFAPSSQPQEAPRPPAFPLGLLMIIAAVIAFTLKK